MKVLLIAYDNDSYIHCFPLGLAYIASALRNTGHNVVIYNQDQFHYPEENEAKFNKEIIPHLKLLAALIFLKRIW